MTKSNDDDKQELEHIVALLKLALKLDDEEIIKSTVESVIDLLEEKINK